MAVIRRPFSRWRLFQRRVEAVAKRLVLQEGKCSRAELARTPRWRVFRRAALRDHLAELDLLFSAYVGGGKDYAAGLAKVRQAAKGKPVAIIPPPRGAA